ncbi:hypothetical protein AB8879_05305 [Alphaproteobacteria bacterium LSUCC0744]
MLSHIMGQVAGYVSSCDNLKPSSTASNADKLGRAAIKVKGQAPPASGWQ